MYATVLFVGTVQKSLGRTFQAIVFQNKNMIHGFTYSEAKNKPISDNLGNSFTRDEFHHATHKYLPTHIREIFLGVRPSEVIPFDEYQTEIKKLFKPKEKISKKPTWDENLAHWNRLCP